MGNFVERLVERKDVTDWLDKHWKELEPIALKVIPFLTPSLVAYAQKNPKTIGGVLCDEIVKAFEAHQSGEES